MGAYYAWLSLNEEAIVCFREVSEEYRDSEVASIAQCALGIIAETLGDFASAREAYQEVISNYPKSCEVIEAKEGLERLALQSQ